jgi:cytochrome c553
MRAIISLFFLIIAFPITAHANKPAKLGLCAACHGENGISRAAGTPHLAGQDEAYLRKSLNDYRTGARKVAPMTSIANQLQPKDIAAFAKWYAAQPGFQSAKKTSARK